MTAPTHRCWLSLPVQLALAVLGWGGICATDARAGCGDYVQILGEQQEHPAPVPCRGPACDRQVPPAVPSPPAPTTPAQPPLDAVLPAADAPDPPRPTALTQRTNPLSITISSTVFRPPRPVFTA